MNPKTPRTNAEAWAKRFHETYERLAPQYGYRTRPDSAVTWEKVPEKNKALMQAVCTELFEQESDEFRAVLHHLINWNPELPFYMRDKDKQKFAALMDYARELLSRERTADASDVSKDAEPQSYGEPQIIH